MLFEFVEDGFILVTTTSVITQLIFYGQLALKTLRKNLVGYSAIKLVILYTETYIPTTHP